MPGMRRALGTGTAAASAALEPRPILLPLAGSRNAPVSRETAIGPALSPGRDAFQTASNRPKSPPPDSQVSPPSSARKRPVAVVNPGASTIW